MMRRQKSRERLLGKKKNTNERPDYSFYSSSSPPPCVIIIIFPPNDEREKKNRTESVGRSGVLFFGLFVFWFFLLFFRVCVC